MLAICGQCVIITNDDFPSNLFHVLHYIDHLNHPFVLKISHQSKAVIRDEQTESGHG